MFLEKRKRGRVTKYYAVHSFREGKQLIKIRKYLGQNLPHAEVYEREKKAWTAIQEQLRQYREIRDPLKYVLSPQELRQLETLEARGDFNVLHLSEDQWRRFSELFSYNTNAIEGSTLTFREVAGLIERKKIPRKPSEDIAEAKGVVEAVAYIRKTKEQFSLEIIKKLHEIVFKDTKRFAGQIRPRGVEVVIRDGAGNIVHRGAPSSQIEALLKELVTWHVKNKKRYSGILLAAVVHNQFENIHPFQDGNGRIGRLLLNYVLLKHKLPPVNIELIRRQEYYEALREYQNFGNIRPMIELMLKEYKQLKKQLR